MVMCLTFGGMAYLTGIFFLSGTYNKTEASYDKMW